VKNVAKNFEVEKWRKNEKSISNQKPLLKITASIKHWFLATC